MGEKETAIHREPKRKWLELVPPHPPAPCILCCITADFERITEQLGIPPILSKRLIKSSLGVCWVPVERAVQQTTVLSHKMQQYLHRTCRLQVPTFETQDSIRTLGSSSQGAQGDCERPWLVAQPAPRLGIWLLFGEGNIPSVPNSSQPNTL